MQVCPKTGRGHTIFGLDLADVDSCSFSFGFFGIVTNFVMFVSFYRCTDHLEGMFLNKVFFL